MITEKELNAPKGKIIIKQLKSQESEINGILIPTAKTYFNKQAEVISVGFMEGGSFTNINDNNKKYKNILLLATGALHSPTLVNQHEEIPAISHAVSLEVL